MLIFVMGKNGSGKSVFAEKLAVGLRDRRYYIATMIPFGNEGAVRVEKHVAQRKSYGFVTLELPYAVGNADVPEDGVVLLEDISNLLSNAMFDNAVSQDEVLSDVEKLCQRVGIVIAVTISEFDDGDYNEETLKYIRSLTWLNQQLGIRADVVVQMCNGVPVFRKGSEECLTQCGLQ